MARFTALLVVLGLAVAAAPAARAAEPIDPARRAEIETIVRDYLLRNPEVLVEAITALENKQKAAESQAAQSKIVANRDALLRDSRDQILGNPQGDVTLVEFFDYRCGYCKQAQPNVLALVAADPKLRVVLKEFPILGPDSVIASRVAQAAIAQGKYDALHNALFAATGKLDSAKIFAIAGSVGLDETRLKTDMQAAAIDKQIEDNHALAEKLGISGTPAFIVGDQLIPGALPLDELQKAIATARTQCSGTC